MSTDLVRSFEKLSLSEAGNADASKFPELTAEQLALQSQWLTLSNRLPGSLADFNANLKDKTYLLGNVASAADVAVFAKALPVASQLSGAEQIASHRHVLRWADLVQNTLVDVPADQKLALDYDVEIPREIKAKPEKKAGAAAGGAEAKKQEKAKKQAAPAAAPAAAPVAATAAATAGAAGAAASGKTPEEIAAEKKAKAEAKKAAKAKANAEKAAKEKAAQVPPNPSMIDFRVGFIEKAIRHPDADGLYVSTIHMGDEEGPRTICSGLVKYVSLEDMQQRYIVTIANLKPVSMRGIKSMGMVLCASDESKEVVEFVNPPPGSQAGDKLFFEGYDGEPLAQLNPKKKIWEACQPNFSTNENYEVVYKQEGKPDAKLVNKKGEVLHNSTIVHAHVS